MSLLEYEESVDKGARVELYLFETDNGMYRWAYTTDARSRNLGGLTYEPEAISRGELKQTAGDANVEKLTITVPFDNPVAVAHVPYLPPRPVRVTIFAYQRNDPSGQIVQGFTGYVTSFNQKGAIAELECSQILDNLSQTVPWAPFKQNCIWATYQDGCFVDKADFEFEAVITGGGGDTLESPEFAAKGERYYTNGFAVNPLTSEERFIVAHDHVAGTITLVHPFLNFVPGQTIKVYAGDDRTAETCHNKFNNKINYLGFDYFPEYNVFQQGIT